MILWLAGLLAFSTGDPVLATLGSLDDWRQVHFSQRDFDTSREFAAQKFIDAHPNLLRAWLAGASGALETLTPTAELLPAALAAEAPAGGRWSGSTEPLKCAGKVLPGVLIHRVPEMPIPPDETPSARSERLRLARAQRQQWFAAWKDISFDRKEFLCVLDDVQLKLGGAQKNGNNDDAVTNVDFAWINATSGYLRALDPHSDIAAATFFQRISEREVVPAKGGVGLRLRQEMGRAFVDDVVDDSPAASSPIRVGDELLKINDVPLTTTVQSSPYASGHTSRPADQQISGPAGESVLNLEAVGNQLRGAPGTKVSLQFRRPSSSKAKPFTVQIVRQPLVAKAVRVQFAAPGILHVRLNIFADGCALEMAQDIRKLSKDPNREKGLIVDLRGNPGGSLKEAIEFADLLLPRGRILTVRKRAGAEELYDASVGPKDLVLPTVVLVDGESASASEVLAEALRENSRALVLGEQTYGKATVQQWHRPLNANYLIAVTMARYFGPTGHSPQRVGVLPDIVVPNLPGVVPQVRPREADLSFALDESGSAPGANALATDELRNCMLDTGAADKKLIAELSPKKKPDYRLLRAMDALRCLGSRTASVTAHLP